GSRLGKLLTCGAIPYLQLMDIYVGLCGERAYRHPRPTHGIWRGRRHRYIPGKKLRHRIGCSRCAHMDWYPQSIKQRPESILVFIWSHRNKMRGNVGTDKGCIDRSRDIVIAIIEGDQ